VAIQGTTSGKLAGHNAAIFHFSFPIFLLFAFLRVVSCGFVDRFCLMATKTIHETTRTDTK
jgi:hypothetical protein